MPSEIERLSFTGEGGKGSLLISQGRKKSESCPCFAKRKKETHESMRGLPGDCGRGRFPSAGRRGRKEYRLRRETSIGRRNNIGKKEPCRAILY